MGASWPQPLAGSIRLVGWDASSPETARCCGYAVVYQRKSELPQFAFIAEAGRLVAEHRNQGVWLARLYELPAPAGELFRIRTPSADPSAR